MSTTPADSPTLLDLNEVLESIGRPRVHDQREVARINCFIPVEVTTSRGNTFSCVTRDISSVGIGILHRGLLPFGEVTIRIPGDRDAQEYRVLLNWSRRYGDGMFISGGPFLIPNTAAS